MNRYLKHQITALTCCCGMLLSCGEKQSTSESKANPEVTEQKQPVASTELIQHNQDGTKPGTQQAYKITADIYDAPALPLGETYTSIKQLTGATRKVAELTNLTNSGHFVKLEKENATFKTEAIAGENGEIMDITTNIKFHDLEMTFSTTLKFGYPAFYEMSMAGDSKRMYVVVLKVEKK